MRITIEGWDPVDKQQVCGHLERVDRAQTQAADIVTVTVSTSQEDETAKNSCSSGGGNASSGSSSRGSSSMSVVLKQNPTLLQKAKAGQVRVGACVWDSAYVMCAYLEQQVQRGAMQLAGARCAELGAGCGLVGLVTARLGASVMLTDKKDVLVHSRGNAAKNKMLWMPGAVGSTERASSSSQTQQQQEQQQKPPQQPPQQDYTGPPLGCAGLMPLDWSAPDAGEAAGAVRDAMGGPLDYVLASDSIYPDPSGCETNAKGFIDACAALCDSHTLVLVTYEWRLPEVRAALLGAARSRFGHVRILGQDELPEGWRTQHVETFEMRLEVAGAASS